MLFLSVDGRHFEICAPPYYRLYIMKGFNKNIHSFEICAPPPPTHYLLPLQAASATKNPM